ncbi:MAG: hypothetical protein ACLQIB_24550 [Isosphaeraceae bacterium]
MKQGQWALAAESLHEAVRMARGVETVDAAAESQLALAKFHLGQLTDPRREAEQLAQARKPAHRALAEFWLAIGDREQAKKHSLAAYKWAWADGEPYVLRYELNKATALLKNWTPRSRICRHGRRLESLVTIAGRGGGDMPSPR